MHTSQRTQTASTDCHVREYAVNDIHVIHVRCRVCRIHVVGTAGSEIRLRWHDTKLRVLDVQAQDGTLEIRERDRAAIYELFALLEVSRDKEILLELPQTFTGDIRLEAIGETVECSGIRAAGKLELRTQTGAVRLSDSGADTLTIRADHGTIHGQGLFAEKEISMSTVTGSIFCQVQGSEKDYAVFCRSQHGQCRAPQGAPGSDRALRLNSNTGSVTAVFAT